MQTFYLNQKLNYENNTLAPHFAYRNFKILGDSIVSFSGACRVDADGLVDLEDVLQGKFIFSVNMLHFIVEHFSVDLKSAVLRQRLLCSLATDLLNTMVKKKIERKGDDLYCGDKKLSVSIATVSTVSCLIHLGLNISSHKTPVKAVGLNDLSVSPKNFAKKLMAAYVNEDQGILKAVAKVKPV
jgi:uncharacterized protein